MRLTSLATVEIDRLMDLAIVVKVDPAASIFEIRSLSWSVNRLYCITRKYRNKNFYISH